MEYGNTLSTIAAGLMRLMLLLTPLGGVLKFAWDVMGGSAGITGRIQAFRATVQSIEVSSGSLLNYGTMFNQVFPLSEVLAMLGVLMTVRVAAMGIRIVKSWIPTLS